MSTYSAEEPEIAAKVGHQAAETAIDNNSDVGCLMRNKK